MVVGRGEEGGDRNGRKLIITKLLCLNTSVLYLFLAPIFIISFRALKLAGLLCSGRRDLRFSFLISTYKYVLR